VIKLADQANNLTMPQEHLVHVPGVARPRSAPAKLAGEVGPELEAPLSDGLVADDDTPLGQDQLHVPEAQAEHVIEPDRVDLMSVSCPEGVTRLVMCR
jgi:hypothetical protein